MTPKIMPAEIADRWRQKRTSGLAQEPLGHTDALLPDPFVSPWQSLARHVRLRSHIHEFKESAATASPRRWRRAPGTSILNKCCRYAANWMS